MLQTSIHQPTVHSAAACSGVRSPGMCEMRCPSSIGLEAWPLKRSLFDVPLWSRSSTTGQHKHGCSRPWVGPITDKSRHQGGLSGLRVESCVLPRTVTEYLDVPSPLKRFVHGLSGCRQTNCLYLQCFYFLSLFYSSISSPLSTFFFCLFVFVHEKAKVRGEEGESIFMSVARRNF